MWGMTHQARKTFLIEINKRALGPIILAVAIIMSSDVKLPTREFYCEKEGILHQMNQVFISKRNYSHDRQFYLWLFIHFTNILDFTLWEAVERASVSPL